MIWGWVVVRSENESYQGMPSQLTEKLKNVCIAVQERPFRAVWDVCVAVEERPFRAV
jgi:hypothetical protein